MIVFQRIMRMILLVFVIIPGSVTVVSAQKTTGYAYVSRMMNRIPDSLTRSANGIAGYINTTFSSQKDKSRSISLWIDRNIKYNFDSIITNSIYETPAEVSERILETRTGVCLNFAHLFNEIANKSGIRSYIVHGYTRQNGRVDFLPHVWCAARIDSAWYLFDPTWGLWMKKPEYMIRTHIPFDPLWQTMNRDSISVWENISEIDQYIASARRIEQRGTKNKFIDAKLRVLKGDIAYLQNKMAADKYDTAVDNYNTGIHTLNKFINFKNSRDSDSIKLIQLLDSTDYHFGTAMTVLDDIYGNESNIISAISKLRNQINDTRMMLNLQRASLIHDLQNRK